MWADGREWARRHFALFQPDEPIPFDERQSFEANELRLLHVAMNRARERIYMTYQSMLPANLEPLERFLQEAKERQ